MTQHCQIWTEAAILMHYNYNILFAYGVMKNKMVMRACKTYAPWLNTQNQVFISQLMNENCNFCL